jgi:hypothetical protein
MLSGKLAGDAIPGLPSIPTACPHRMNVVLSGAPSARG